MTKMNFEKEFRDLVILFLAAIVFVIVVVFVGVAHKPGKYKIQAGDSVYYCNDFTVSGNSIYFKDSDHHNIVISGQYTLIYDKPEEYD